MQRLLTLLLSSAVLCFFVATSAIYAEDASTNNFVGEDIASAGTTLNLYGATITSVSQDEEEEAGITSKKGIRIINLGPVINYEGLDYAPTISADGRTLYYVSDREGSKLYQGNEGDFSHDFWASKKKERLDTNFSVPYNIDTSIELGNLGVNTPEHEGAASIAADRQSLYFTACDRPDGLGSCDLYKTVIEGDKWARPTNMGKNVNSKYFDSQPSISPDQSRVYFISTRPGPNSDGDPTADNFDIWYSDYDYDMEDWLPAKNLTELNTPATEVSPFIAADNQTLFFGSNGHIPTVGGQDFYVSRFNEDSESWGAPDNLGEPINTEKDEQFISLPASGDVIYFSSKREDLDGYQGNFDIFMAFVPTYFRAVTLTGTVIDECSRENIPAKITVTNPITGRIWTDSLTLLKTQFQLIISNNDYGKAKDSATYVDLEISAANVKYGSTSIIKRINKPGKTEDAKLEGSIATEIKVGLTLGQIPVLDTEIAEANHIKINKAYEPELKGYNGLVMKEIITWNLYPLLNYIFFDQGKSELRPRYKALTAGTVSNFNDTTIPGGTMDKYYHILNIYGYRLKNFPDAKIELIGCNDKTTPEEKVAGLSAARVETIFKYFTEVWGIDAKRIKKTIRKLPKEVSNLKDSLGIQENRRVEMICKDWNVMKPIFDKTPTTFPQPDEMNFLMANGIEDKLITDRRIEIKRNGKMWKVLNDIGLMDKKFNWDWMNDDADYPLDEANYECQLIVKTKSGSECKSEIITIPTMQVSQVTQEIVKEGERTQEVYNLILFKFDSHNAGPINDRIMKDYIFNRILTTSQVEVDGHTDVVGLNDHNMKLSIRRSGYVEKNIIKRTKKKYESLVGRGVGEDEALYTNETPEGRFYNRTVQVRIATPLSEFQKKAVPEEVE
ncbi:MAG: OmpA family protein [Candidatus Kapabacteria bacterium]|jgi:outer membrane protein OmpA-like peptidoglycan-associated protein|nr:OmpA family protein [Candidatus Kapabacteria bacterium]